jgi:isoleucyl-tRNA synthetase
MTSYKDTCRLPKTDFPLTAELPKNEPTRYAKWDAEKVYTRMTRGSENPFILHDGPPYANGNIHIGHALNKVLKDFIVKQHYFKGRGVSFVPGWDCHGLPIERAVVAKDNTAQNAITRRQMCRTYAKEQIDLQMKQFKSLGIVADWDNHYETMSFKFESDIFRSLCELYKKRLVVLQHKPVLWSWAEGTALADAEVEYKDKKDDSIYVIFPSYYQTFPNGLLVWTTTPWTLMSNVAVALNPNEVYGTVLIKGKAYIAAKKLIPTLIEKGVAEADVGREFTAQEVKNLDYFFNPLNTNCGSELVFADFVKTDCGTGCVHIAPGHGEEDYEVGKTLGYYGGVRGPAPMPVDENGRYTEEVAGPQLLMNSKYVGMNVLSANKVIIEDLKEKGYLLKVEEITHNYPFCSRSGKPMIFRATKQWFVDLDKLRGDALAAVASVEFVPEINKGKLKGMVEGRPDWCISRQRAWGVPIAFLNDLGASTSPDLYMAAEYLLETSEKEGFDSWWLGDDILCENRLKKCKDILDVWFDSGLTWLTLNGKQADLYLEGHDQHRGWFQSSLWLSVALAGQAPYKKVLTHGFVMDGKGEKMAKSKGNVISPSEIVDKHGAEVLRYWVAMTDYTKDVCISGDIINRSVEGYKKIRNSLRYLLANLPDIKPEKPEKLLEIDSWILSKSKAVFDSVHAAFDRYDFCTGLHELTNFVYTDLSAAYMNTIKDRMYCGTDRQSTEYAMSLLLKSMTGLLAPLFTYTMDEYFSYWPAWLKGEAKDVFDLVYEPLPTVELTFDETHWKTVLHTFNATVEPFRKEGIVKDTMELRVYTMSQKVFAEAAEWLSVSSYNQVQKSVPQPLATFDVDGQTYWVVVSGQLKCQRCRKRTADAELCNRCKQIVG